MPKTVLRLYEPYVAWQKEHRTFKYFPVLLGNKDGRCREIIKTIFSMLIKMDVPTLF